MFACRVSYQKKDVTPLSLLLLPLLLRPSLNPPPKQHAAMMSTPRRVTGSFPQTPGTARPRRSGNPPAQPAPRPSLLPVAPENEDTAADPASQPLIPLALLDGHTQRFYAFAIYVGLLAYRLYDWVQLVETDEASWALFVKWMIIDLVYLFGLPELRIPWLELSQPVVVGLYCLHGALNFMLMFNIPVCPISYTLRPLTRLWEAPKSYMHQEAD